jgi:hypothetical protein
MANENKWQQYEICGNNNENIINEKLKWQIMAIESEYQWQWQYQ